MHRIACLLLMLLVGTSPNAIGAEFDTSVEMRAKVGATLYVSGRIAGFGTVQWMVDTGSGYMTINEDMLAALQENGRVRFVKRMRGRLANGSELDVPVYSLDALSIGDACWLRNVEVAVFPGSTRPILGLNALQRAAPFIFSFEPPRLVLSHCDRGADNLALAPAVGHE